MKRDGYERGWSCKQYSRILNSRNSLIRFYCDILVKHISCKYHTQVYINHKMLNIVLTYNFGQFKTVEIIRALWCKNMFCCVRLHCASLCSSHTQNRLLQWNRGVLLSEIFHHYKNWEMNCLHRPCNLKLDTVITGKKEYLFPYLSHGN